MVGDVAQQRGKGADIGCGFETVVFFRHSPGGARQITLDRIVGRPGFSDQRVGGLGVQGGNTGKRHGER